MKLIENLKDYKHVCIDLETKDTGLKKFGPGPRRKGNYILGAAIAVQDQRCYIPIAHPDSENMPIEKFKEYMDYNLNRRDKIIIGANILYDLDWLQSRGIKFVGAKYYDVLLAEHLLNEEMKVSLDMACKLRLKTSKNYTEINELGKKIDPKKNSVELLYRMPAKIVEKYAIPDAVLPLQLFKKQIPLLKKENLLPVMDIECRLIPLLLEMRAKGVKVDYERKNELKEQLQKEYDDARSTLDFNPHSSKATGAWLIKNNFPVSRTAKGNVSVTKDWLEANKDKHQGIQTILDLRVIKKLLSTYLENMFDNYMINGRIYTLFHQVSLYDGGTRSGRFSSSHPNLQNIPARDKRYAKLIRQLFVPEDGQLWGRFDYSQIEYRLLAHYCLGLGSDKIREQYNQDPNIDFHKMCGDLIKATTNIDLDRKKTKTINFGMVYGMGQKKMQSSLGVDPQLAYQLLNSYHATLPFIKKTYDAMAKAAKTSGEIITLSGRKRRFPWFMIGANPTTDIEAAKQYSANTYVNLSSLRMNTQKGLNSLLQGGAADMLKIAMVKLYEGGICDESIGLGVPLLTIHDELDFSYNNSNHLVITDAKKIMEDAIKIKVPVVVDFTWGADWGECD